ncbi:MAG TPA: hypothetical protein VJ718_10220 [Candidatus Binataceae bacterium]|nr:hypothetical protein [Candidatus Binataceae bacterium]
MNAISHARKFEAILLSALAACWLFGCARGRTVDLHYLAVPSSHTPRLFFPAAIAVAPTEAAHGMKIGAVFDANGYREMALRGGDLASQIAEIVAASLAAAGLKPKIMNVSAGDLPEGVDFVLSSSLESLHCVKRYVGDGAPGGAFVMYADARIAFTLAGRGGKLYSATKSSQLEEPARGADIAKYKLPFVDPADAASAVVSRTIAQLIADPEFQQVLPHEAMPSATPTPSATPSPAPSPHAR